MEVTVTQNYQVTAKAVLRDNELKLSINLGYPYGKINPRIATHIVEEFPEEITNQVRAALQAVIESRLEKATEAARTGAIMAEIAARRLGEVL